MTKRDRLIRMLVEDQKEQKWALAMKRRKASADEVEKFFTLPAEPNKMEVVCRIGDHDGLMRKARETFNDPVNKRQSLHLVDQYRSGNPNPGIGTNPLIGTPFYKLRAKKCVRLYIDTEIVEEIKKIIVMGISDKDNQNSVIANLCYYYATYKN